MRAQSDTRRSIDDGDLGEAAQGLRLGFDGEGQSDRCEQKHKFHVGSLSDALIG
jgi:hypothetical protein